MWWTLNLTPNLTRVCTFGCRHLSINELGSIPNSIGNLTNLDSSWAPFGVRNWRDSITRPHTPWKKITDALKPDFATIIANILGAWSIILGAHTCVWGDLEVSSPTWEHPSSFILYYKWVSFVNGIVVGFERIVLSLWTQIDERGSYFKIKRR